MSAEPKRRASWLSVTQMQTLHDWSRNVSAMFGGATPYLVGSAVQRPDFRDVDVRLVLTDAQVRGLGRRLDVARLNYVVSLWGQQATGLPIDFQVQDATEALRHPEHLRRPLRCAS